MSLAAGTRLGHFEIIAPLGAGGMGEVYRATDRKLGRVVALKVISESFGRNSEALSRLEREAKVVAALSHPNILAVYQLDRDEATGIAFIAAELLEGETLRERLTRGPLPWRKAAEIGGAVAEGLAAAHAIGIVHRDLKPENIFLTQDSRVKILDFGLARDIRAFAELKTAAPTERHSTDPGTILGTVGYMSPEQVRGESTDARSDIFSLGCVLFEAMSGTRPFRASTGAETVSAILRDDPPAAELTSRQTPAELIAILEHCLEKNREARFQSARDLSFDLKAVASGSFTPRPGGPIFQSIAVLPFRNESEDPEAEYLSDGITESIISRLSRLPRLRVMARSTTFRFKSSEVNPQQIGATLGVSSVLTGRVRQRGDTLVIRTELVDVTDGAQLWGERFNRKAADLFEVEEEIAREISERLRIHLSGEDKVRLTERQTENHAAYDAWLKGRYHWNKRNESGMRKGIDFFKEALESDPNYALAWAGIADSFNVLGFYSFLPPTDAFPKAESAARKALEISPDLAQAHTSLGYATHYFRWEWGKAERMFRQAIDLEPNYSFGSHAYANLLTCTGRFEEGISAFRRALELEPLSLITNAGLGWALYFARDYDAAIRQLRTACALDEGFAQAHIWLSWALTAQSMFREAIAEAERALAVGWTNDSAGSYAHACASSGDVERARKTVEEMIARGANHYLQAGYPALVYAALGDRAAALQWLNRAFQDRSHFMTFLKIDPRLDALRTEPDFEALVKRVGL